MKSMGISRRTLLSGSAAAATTFAGPWAVNRVWAQAKTKKPILIGLTTDDTGLYAASGQDEQRGIRMAIAEFNARGGILGRRIETYQADTGGNPERAESFSCK